MLTNHPPARRGGRRPRTRLIVAFLIAVAGTGTVWFLFSQQHVFRVSLGRGETAIVELDVPLQRLGRLKSFAKQQVFPVSCAILPA